MYSLLSFLNGIIFGAGLTISNMINPYKILNFLDITGHWDPALLVVMAAARSPVACNRATESDVLIQYFTRRV